MENFFSTSGGGSSTSHRIHCCRGQNGGDLLLDREDLWALNNNNSNNATTSRFDNWCNLTTTPNTTSCSANSTTVGTTTAAAQALFTLQHHNGYVYNPQQQHHHPSLYGGDGSHLHPDPHLMCLKLGKRQYFEDAASPVEESRQLLAAGLSIGKRGKCYGGVNSAAAAAAVPRCQVEGCHVELVNVKDYHRRHKVCEMHSKAPRVMVLGLEQRFCQQCSRFHVVSEFDDSKRSCRRRLAGHNERRRKSSHDSVSKNTSQDKLIMGRFQYLTSPTGCALSLLSSKADSWVPSSDISSRSSAALRELIAEHRAAILTRQLILDRHLHHRAAMDHDNLGSGDNHPPISNFFTQHQHQALSEPPDWEDRFHDNGSHVTLDLMQAPTSAFGFLSTRAKNKEEAEAECSELWNSFF